MPANTTPVFPSRSIRGYLLQGLLLVGLASGCASTQEQLHSSLRDAGLWSHGVDPYGSSVIIGDSLIHDGAARIAFNRAPQPSPDIHTWIELIYQAPEGNLAGTQAVRITYQCSDALLMKFSQRDYGADGDNSYAHYQTLLPASSTWKTLTVTLADFARPAWTPVDSADVGLIMQNVTAIYLAPALDDIAGGYAELNVSAIELIP